MVREMTVATAKQAAPSLGAPITALWGVGPERAAQLARLEIRTIEDLLLHRPRRYEDRRQFHPIAELQMDEPALTRGKVVALGVKWFRQHTKSIFELILDDGTARLHCRWWNLPYMENYFAVGDEVVLFGKLAGIKPRTVDHPETEVIATAETGDEAFIHLNRITPIYPLTEGLAQRWLRALIWRTLERYESQIDDPWSLAPKDLDLTVFESRPRAVRLIHFPDESDDVERARRRLALDEFIDLQRQMLIRRRNLETKAQAIPCHGDNRLMKPFLARLGFKLTDAQTTVLRQLRQDLTGPHPMRRLLQGDVGSGKTVVAACCALMALESGHNAALMAPTEILAEQHFQNFSRWFGAIGVPVDIRTGSHKETRIPSGSVQASPTKPSGSQANSPLKFTIGTHALIGSGFTAENLGLVIIDEQHKFGVTQREQFLRKGRYPHLLVMTATPIPRTLGLTLYGDLDVATIGQMPPGRGRIQTFVRTADSLPKVWDFVRSKLKQGRQAYVVYPRVEETGENGVKAVTRELASLVERLAPFRVGLVHGRLGSKDKEAVMTAFRANQLQVLLATALIEVGVDVPNATIMVIENAEQFGLAQLHQLRGRVGRGAHDSYCVLVASAKTKEARHRLRVMEKSNDGFEIAEADLKLRGPGELLGQEQSGMPRFRFGNLAEDLSLIEQARTIAGRIYATQPNGGKQQANSGS